MSSARYATTTEQDYRSARLACDRLGGRVTTTELTRLLNDLGVLNGAAQEKGAFYTAPPEPGSLPVPQSKTTLECGTVKGAQAHHRADEPLCTVCQDWSDKRHQLTKVAPGSRCGTPAGAQMHRQLGERVCERCTAKNPGAVKPAVLKVTSSAHSWMTLAELAQFVIEAFDAGAEGTETVTAATHRVRSGSVIREARLEIRLDPETSDAPSHDERNTAA